MCSFCSQNVKTVQLSHFIPHYPAYPKIACQKLSFQKLEVLGQTSTNNQSCKGDG